VTEAEWLACTEPDEMVAFVVQEGDDRLEVRESLDSEPQVGIVRGWASERKFRLLASACCRRNRNLMTHNAFLEFLHLFEEYVEGQATPAEVHDAGHEVIDTLELAGNLVEPSYLALSAAIAIARGSPARLEALRCSAAACTGTDEAEWQAAVTYEKGAECELLREVFGNPCRPVTLDLAWRTATVTALATAAYEEQHLAVGTLDPQRLAILADALEDAGCTDEQILGHLRGLGPHVRGC
jgi:hypothetical protein